MGYSAFLFVAGLFAINSRHEDLGALLILLSIVAIIAVLVIGAQKITEWESFPTVDEYLEKENPIQDSGIACSKCKSRNIWEKGFEDSSDDKRLHYCKQCKTPLYRTERKELR